MCQMLWLVVVTVPAVHDGCVCCSGLGWQSHRQSASYLLARLVSTTNVRHRYRVMLLQKGNAQLCVLSHCSGRRCYAARPPKAPHTAEGHGACQRHHQESSWQGRQGQGQLSKATHFVASCAFLCACVTCDAVADVDCVCCDRILVLPLSLLPSLPFPCPSLLLPNLFERCQDMYTVSTLCTVHLHSV